MKGNRIPAIVASAILALVGTISPALADTFGCEDFDRSTTERINACTKALEQPSLERDEKAWWLVFRALAHEDRAEYSAAETDFKAATVDASPEERAKALGLASIMDPLQVDAKVPFGHAW